MSKTIFSAVNVNRNFKTIQFPDLTGQFLEIPLNILSAPSYHTVFQTEHGILYYLLTSYNENNENMLSFAIFDHQFVLLRHSSKNKMR